MSKRTLKEYKGSASTRGPVVREVKEHVATDIVQKAEEDLTSLGEQETAAEAENDRVEQDQVESQPGSIAGEAPPMGFSTGGID